MRTIESAFRPAMKRALIAFLAAGAISCESRPVEDTPPPVPQEATTQREERNGDQDAHSLDPGSVIKVVQGSLDDAKKYYEGVAAELDIKLVGFKIDTLLGFCGHGDRTAQSLLRGGVIDNADAFSVSFFAPKITDVSRPNPKLGWRKIVRLKARDGSTAKQKGITEMYLLFNVFVSKQELQPPGADPFAKPHRAGNNQAILIGGKRKAYWFVFGDVDKGGPLAYALDATFDARDPDLPAPEKQYFVPHACEQCHGGQEKPKLAYIDTDHLYDRVQVGDDFQQMREVSAAVLFDGGKVKADGGTGEISERYEKAFERVRRLNREIQAQICASDPECEKHFSWKAVTNWLSRHGTSSAYLSPIQRPIPGTPVWGPTSPTDSRLLPLLNRYCFRCHSSIRFHVFDKGAVVQRAKQGGPAGMIQRLEGKVPGLAMPQDRNLSREQIEELKGLIEALKKENP